MQPFIFKASWNDKLLMNVCRFVLSHSTHHVHFDTRVNGIDVKQEEAFVKQSVSVNSVMIAKSVPETIQS